MNNLIIEEAIYDIKELQIEPRKRNIVLPITILLAGAALIFIAYKLDPIASNPNLSSGCLLFGFIGIITGLVKLISSITSKGAPFHIPTNEKLKKYELKFDAGLKEKVKRHISEGDFESLTDLPQEETSAVKAVIYKTRSGELMIAQTQEYAPHLYRPAGEVKVFRKGEYIRSAKLA